MLNGSSTCEYNYTSDSALEVNYQLGPEYLYAFSGLSLEVQNDKKHFDLTKYSHFNLDLHAEKASKIPIQLMVKNLETTLDSAANFDQLIPFECMLDYSSEVSVYSMDIHQFKIPNWWRMQNPNVPTKKISDYKHQVGAITIGSCVLLGKEIKDTYTIRSIAFLSYSSTYVYVFSMGCFLSIFTFIILYYRRKKTVVVSYQETEAPVSSFEDKLLPYINSKYSDPELSINSIKSELGISENKISKILKEIAQMNFKQYVNSIRIIEAKRLLKRDSNTVSEIAYQVGYSNVTHFNRVFKSAADCSPSDYRKLNN